MPAMAHTPKDIKYDTTRTPWMISPNVAVVFTEWRTKGHPTDGVLTYADILMKEGGQWRFQSMVQGGWGDMLKAGK